MSGDYSRAQPLVSIGMPVYNGERFIRQALDSLLAQTYQNLEIIISDNASTDATQNICSEYTRKCPCISYYRNDSNIGPFENFKRVLRLASGEYFCWAAVDDVREAEFVSTLMMPFQEDAGVSLSCCDYNTVFHLTGEVLTIPGTHFPSLSANNTPIRTFVELLKKPHPSYIYGLYPTHLLRESRFVKRKYPFDWGDVFLSLEMSLKGRIHRTPDVLFSAGVKESRRIPYSLARMRLLSFPFNYSEFYFETFSLILRAVPFSRRQKLVALRTLSNVVRDFISNTAGARKHMHPLYWLLTSLDWFLCWLDKVVHMTLLIFSRESDIVRR